uniref:Putative heme-binding protein 2 n=1 Tax=Davidia involucrata TaxID=16924 RepID=A0A5B7BF28_DAVIN
MERKQPRLRLGILVVFLCCCSCCCCKCNAIESPQYRVVHSESDLEIRLYRESSWVSALVRGATSFEKSTKDGFHRLYQYIHGSNLNSSRFMMTTPILTSITPSENGSDYFVRFYLSSKYEGGPPQPYPELNLLFDKWTSHCVAVRKFSGFAKDDNISKEIEALVTSLDKILTGKTANMKDKNSYTIAQYNASSHLSGRLNEVWMNVSGFTAEGCPSY